MSATKKVLLLQLYGDLQPDNVEPLSIEVLCTALEREMANVYVRKMIINPRVDDYSLDKLWTTLSANKFDLGAFHLS